MFEGQRIGAILLMAGLGQRFESPTPKQFHLLGNKRVYQHTLDVFLKTGVFDEILLVCHPDWVKTVEEEILHLENVKIVFGKETRQLSSFEGLKSFSINPDIVSIHDAVRPFVTEEILLNNLRGAISHGAVDTCIPTADTLVHSPNKNFICSIPPRGEFLRGQTPQTFLFDWIKKAHLKALNKGLTNSTDDCSLAIDLGKKVYITFGSEKNIKITSQFDLEIAENILRQKILHQN